MNEVSDQQESVVYMYAVNDSRFIANYNVTVKLN